MSITGRKSAMRVTCKGQVTIPQEIRRFAGITPDSEVKFRYENGRVWLVKAKEQDQAEKIRPDTRAAARLGHG
jgi:antitoxin PrlF